MIDASRAQVEKTFEQDYNHDFKVGATQAVLSRILRSLDLVGWSRREESGRLDKRSLARFAVGDANLFSRRIHAEAERAAVSIFVDCSGSMQGRMKYARTVTIQLAKMLEKAKVSFAVTGFRGGSIGIRENGEYVTRKELVELIPFKPWKVPLRKARAELGSMEYAVNSSTPDYGGLYVAIRDISTRPESKKIIFFLTDANNFDQLDMKRLEDLAMTLKVKLVPIGIQSEDIKRAFSNGLNINDPSELGEASFRALLSTMR